MDFDLDKLIGGDNAEWSRFERHYRPLLRSFLCSKGWHLENQVDDILQDLWIQMPRSLTGYKRDSSLDTFLYRIATNKGIDVVRKMVRFKDRHVSLVHENDDGEEVETDLPDSEDNSPFAKAVKLEQAGVMSELLQGSGATCAQALTLRYKDALSFKEIAERLGITVNTVGSRLAKCLEKLKKYLKDNPGMWEDLGGQGRL